MSIKSITLAVGATSITVVGGTATLFKEDDVQVNNGVHVSDPATSYLTRPNIAFRSRPAALLSDGTWSKAKRMVTVVQPKTLASGATTFNVGRFDIEAHPECTNAEVIALVILAAQAYLDSEASDFTTAGSLA